MACLVVPVYHRYLSPTAQPLSVWLPVSIAFLLYPIGAWSLKRVLWTRWPAIEQVLVAVDLLLLMFVVYFTGAQHSWLFFLPLMRVADQMDVSFRRSVIFALAVPTLYALLIAYLVYGEGQEIDFTQEAWKLMALLLAGLYLGFIAKIADNQRRIRASTIRAAQQTIRQLETESRKLVISREEWRDQALRDPLTSLLNRKGIFDIVERGLQRAQSGRAPFSVVLADLDGFKDINDRMGHANR